MQIIFKNINELIPYDKNPRKNDDAVNYVANSIREFGFKVPIIIDSNNTIVCGHTRLRAAKRLKITEIPCIIANDLTDAQIKAFRLADNKVSEKAEWDFNLLDDELNDLFNFDMSAFGFELFEDTEEELKSNEEPKENERIRTNNTYNLDLIDYSKLDGFYEMPIIECDDYIPKKIKSFNYALSSKEFNFGLHFYIDDYQFERLWNSPYDYVDILKEFDCIFSPDFSLYMDMPMSMKIWNVYRSRLIGQFYQNCGIKVIPTISWAEEATFKFCFDGIPNGSIVSVSTVGVKRDKAALKIWKAGMDAMIEQIKPKAILVYGGALDYDYKDIKVVYYDNENTERLKNIKKSGD